MSIDYYPLILLGVGILTIVVLILWLRVNAFLALIAAALLIGFLSPRVMLEQPPGATQPELRLFNSPERVAFAFGDTMGKIGLVIALATIVGRALMDSGAADRIVRAFNRAFGERFAPMTLLFSGFLLAIPVFFDTVFLLLVPLAKALRLRTGKDYLLYLVAIGAGGAVTHSLVPPTPGPIIMSETLRVDLGMTILVGIAVGLPLSFGGYFYATLANKWFPVPLRQVGEQSLEELEQTVRRPDSELPSLAVSLSPILVPVLLITASTVAKSMASSYPIVDSGWSVAGVTLTLRNVMEFLGNKNMALIFSTLLAMAIVAHQKRMSRRELGTFTASALDEAGMILLVTSAGGAFGAMLLAAGVGEPLGALAKEWGLPYLFMAWFIAMLFKVAQGSGTVAIISSSAIMLAIIVTDMIEQGLIPEDYKDPEKLSAALKDVDNLVAFQTAMAKHLTFHPVYILMAIGAGSKICSWMNDSGFWVVCKMGGLTETETLKSWTVCLVVMGIIGLPLVLLLSKLLPLV